MSADIPWQRAERHNFSVANDAVEVAHFRGVPMVAYRAPIGPLCTALNRTFVGETIDDAKQKAQAYVQSASDRLLDDRRVSPQAFRRAYGLVM